MPGNIKNQIIAVIIIAALTVLLALLTKSCNDIRTKKKSGFEFDSASQTSLSDDINQTATQDQPGKISVNVLGELVRTRSAIVVDARLKTMFDKGHIPGAVNLSALRPQKKVLDKILSYPDRINIVVYCESENCTDSESVVRTLKSKGMKNVRTLDGGWKAWKENGYITETGSLTP